MVGNSIGRSICCRFGVGTGVLRWTINGHYASYWLINSVKWLNFG